MSLVIGHFVGRYLPRSETFTYELIHRLAPFDHRIFTTRTENLDLFPTPHLVTAQSEHEYLTLAARESIGLALCHFGPMGLTGLQVGLTHAIPVVTIFHGYDASMLLRDPRWLERYRALFNFGSHAICVSEAGRQRLIAAGCPTEKVSTIHLGVDVATFACREASPRPTRQTRILMVARLTEKKGIGFAMRALRRAIDRGASLSLRIVGEGEDRTALGALRRELRLEAHVEFAGVLDSEGVRREMQDCDLYLQPSVTAANGDQEGIPVSLMEAMASGLPVIATRHSGIPELIVEGESGLLVDEHDERALSNAIATLSRDAALARTLALAGRRCVEKHFNLPVQAARFGALLADVAARYQPWRRSRIKSIGRAKKRAATRILFIRCVPVPAALTKLLVLRQRYPDAEMTVLTNDVSLALFEKCPLAHRTIAYSAPRLSMDALDAATLRLLRNIGFDRVVVPYGHDGDSGLEQVEEVAVRTGARVVTVMLPSDQEVDGVYQRRSA